MSKSITYDQFKQEGLLDELVAVFDTREKALGLIASEELAEVGLKATSLREFNALTAQEYWTDVARRLDDGVIHDGFFRLVCAAARIYPGSQKFGKYAPGLLKVPSVQPFQIDIRADDLTPELLKFYEEAKRLARKYGGKVHLDIVTQGSTRFHMSIEGINDQQAEELAQEIQRTLPAEAKAVVSREPYRHRDYMMDPLFLEGPDGQSFAVDNLRASTRVRDVGQELMGTYEKGFWPTGKPPVVDVRTPAGETRRLQPNQTLHDAGVRPHDTLCIYPERTAGGVNPLLRYESITMVRNQILDFAAQHPDFHVAANSADTPTEYLFRFRAPGFAPPRAAGGEPVRIDEHEVLLVMPPDFPVGAPQAYWQRDLFHPNVARQTGLVCLGVLAESYRPGLHFGVLCQMLIDMACYRSYVVLEGYDAEAARWAISEAGRQAIRAIGGRSPEEAAGLAADDQPRRLQLRRVS